MSEEPSSTTASPAEKVRKFPTTPGVYVMKDAQGRVIYLGKAKNLRSRASSYFQKTAETDKRICDWIGEVVDIDYLVADSEVDALLLEARLIKDIQPKHNQDLKDDKSFPYLQITTGEDFPRVNFTREPQDRNVKLYGPFPRAKSLRGAIQVLQRIFKFRTCSLDIEEGDPRWRWFRPCLLHSIEQCTAPCNLRIDKEAYRTDIRRLRLFLDGKKDVVLKELADEMREASKALLFEKAARLRDEIKALETLNLRGDLAKHAQPEVFYVDPRKGLKGLKNVLKLDSAPRTIDCVDIAHLGGTETVGSLVTFIDGMPFKPGYRRYKIKSVKGVDDYASIREVVSRRIIGLQERDEPFPDIFLIDGGKGQLSAALDAFESLKVVPPTVISLAKREEEIYLPGQSDPIVLSRRSFALRLLQYARDEAHRFAQHYHHMLRHKRTFGEDVPPAPKKRLQGEDDALSS
ncbi:excinuclease ABC subunit UvrC [Singulisphaera acidiphila]|uniref:Putative endonuclease n=1 Tax=Singulisphaera acidiphila (strain ATCC BAA-1392 / DSM 18658 / VKM B-2454 / MOB10) TaxID=886293 RepID=L0DM80_SINAD|nr:excinuclease ABC subunit UvrC [Singulisphaera acidiphila]AGA29948.1 putative endonuclease [Singulisphaera acidiphila DSM 18658]